MTDAPKPELTVSESLCRAIKQAIGALAEEAAAYDPPIAHVVEAHEALSAAYRSACAPRPEITDAERLNKLTTIRRADIPRDIHLMVVWALNHPEAAQDLIPRYYQARAEHEAHDEGSAKNHGIEP